MNIVLIGSCTDSSDLAKELNKRLNNSIVARVDLLKNIKQVVLFDRGLRTTENLGTYVGDVETFDYSKLTGAKKATTIASLTAINDMVKDLTKGASYATMEISTFDALTRSLPSGTYSFIKVYSGAIDDQRLTALAGHSSFLNNSVIITLKNPKDLMLPISISTEMKERLQREAFAFIECNNVEDVFKSEVFQLLFELNDDKKTETKAEPQAVTTVDANITLTEPWVAEAVAMDMAA